MADTSDTEPEPLTWLERLLAMAVRRSAWGVSWVAASGAETAARTGLRDSLHAALWHLTAALEDA